LTALNLDCQSQDYLSTGASACCGAKPAGVTATSFRRMNDQNRAGQSLRINGLSKTAKSMAQIGMVIRATING
jgi:hypothetical protein